MTKIAGTEITHQSPAEPSNRPPVLLMHGAWHNAASWQPWLDYFAEAGYDAYAYSWPGHGSSAGDYRSNRLKPLIAQAREVIAALPAPPVLVAHSFGGFIAQHLMAEAIFPAAVLLAPTPPHGFPPSVLWQNQLRHPREMFECLRTGDMKPLAATPELVRESFFTPATPQSIVDNCFAALTGDSPRLFTDVQFNAPAKPISDTPTLIISAELDAGVKPADHQAMARQIGAEIRVIPGSGHDIQLDSPWHTAADQTLAWLNYHAPGTTNNASVV